jgi:hypothetical protein
MVRAGYRETLKVCGPGEVGPALQFLGVCDFFAGGRASA